MRILSDLGSWDASIVTNSSVHLNTVITRYHQLTWQGCVYGIIVAFSHVCCYSKGTRDPPKDSMLPSGQTVDRFCQYMLFLQQSADTLYMVQISNMKKSERI